MPTETVPNTLNSRGKLNLLNMLENIGSSNLANDLMNTLLNVLDPNLLNNQEFLLRYLLLAAVLDQQAESDSARQTVKEIFRKYGDSFFMQPSNYFSDIHSVLHLALEKYSPRSRVLRMKKEGITFHRIGGFLLAIHSISHRFGSLYGYFTRFKTPTTLLNKGILGEPLLSGLLYEKAARLYVGWITHPQLFVKIYGNSIPKDSIPMVVNGHVTKVLARTGFLDKVSVENRVSMIVEAERERTRIEDMVKSVKPGGDLFSIDYGAFYIGMNYCYEQNPNCGECPLNAICRRNIIFRAY